ncbi:MAG: NAD-dependent epimerase [Cyclobacteriaceae bacterium]|nr:NAD-dependent epimerase [Cyclobacteriaceae bacterium]
MNQSQPILVTGAAGFIGFHLINRLLADGNTVVGLDNLNEYYDVNLKKNRLKILQSNGAFTFEKLDLTAKEQIDSLFERSSFSTIIHMAAQAGVRHSITHPYTYIESNVVGFLNILEACRRYKPKHLIYASSSSVYGANQKIPFSTHDNVDHPLALYAATKKSNELMAHAYSTLYGIPTTGLRFFSAYGTYGRPDMALFIFTRSILEGTPINVYNFGKMKRDFTYVDDLVECIIRLIPKIPSSNFRWDGLNPDPSTSFAPFRLFNIGNGNTVELVNYIDIIERRLGKKAIRNYLPMQDGDVANALADVSDLEKEIDFKPSTPIEVGVNNFIDWYLSYYN